MSEKTTKTKLGEAVAFTNSREYQELTAQQKTQYVRDDAYANGYAWGRLDQGHPAIASLDEKEAPSLTASAWAFGALYAQMLLEYNDPAPDTRSWAPGVESAWKTFAETGCPDGKLP